MPAREMRQKILSFITDGKKFLALRNNPDEPEKHGGDFWFTVTGSIELNESREEAVKREISEETGIYVKKTIDLNWSSRYEWQGEDCEEYNFVAFVKHTDKITLNEEHIEYKWLPLDDFVKLIRWDDDKQVLKEVLEKSLVNKKI